MRLTQIDILKYKSIKQSVSVVLSEGKIISFIGKNGSGKTNVLEAIKCAFTDTQDYRNKPSGCKVQYRIELTDEEMAEYFYCTDVNEKNKEIVVDFDNDKARYIESSAIWIEAQNFKSRLEDVLERFKKSATKYLTALKKLESDNDYNCFYSDISIENGDDVNFTRLKSADLKFYESNLIRQIEEIKRYLDTTFEGNRILLSKHNNYSYPFSRAWNVPVYKIVEKDIYISPIIAGSLRLSKQDLDKANDRLKKYIRRLNKELETEAKEIQIQLEEFDKIQEEIKTIFDGERGIWDKWDYQNEQYAKKFESIMQKLKNVVYSTCYYLDNENTLLFYDKSNERYDNYSVLRNINKYLNYQNPIVGAFDTFLQRKGVFSEKIGFSKMKEDLTKNQINHAIKILNKEFLPSIVPKFDDNEIVKFSVEYDGDKGAINLFVHEKNGDKVSFYNTSLGRRWYLTYQFVKTLLKSGDILFIDEPAAFLHPQAQCEIKSELVELGRKGIYVFYTTHSPYMIPQDWGQVHNVIMTENGTQITAFESGDDLCEVIRDQLGVTNATNILFNLEKTLFLVEGVADMVCIKKFADLLNYDLNGYKILPCNGSPIFDVTYLCIKQGIKFKALFDLDNKNKPQIWMNKKYGYYEYLKIFETNKDCVFTPSIRQSKSLEDCFHENDNTRYFFDYKWKDKNGERHIERKIDKEKIINATEFEEETVQNFEQLFIKLDIPKLD